MSNYLGLGPPASTTCHEFVAVEAFAFIVWIIRQYPPPTFSFRYQPDIKISSCSHGVLLTPSHLLHYWRQPWS